MICPVPHNQEVITTWEMYFIPERERGPGEPRRLGTRGGRGRDRKPERQSKGVGDKDPEGGNRERWAPGQGYVFFSGAVE